jgi:formylglycine-generating enzyme required for sulfatase activity
LAERRVPEEMKRLLGTCLAAKAERRPEDAAILAERLKAVMDPSQPDPLPNGGSGPKAITNPIGMEFVRIPAGKFRMGSPSEEPVREADEGPQREVGISREFYLGVYPVTQAQYERIMGTNPSYFSAGEEGSDRVQGLDTGEFPVEHVTWGDAVEFCRRLSALPEEQAAGRVYELPTEAEWEYACRAGTTAVFNFGGELNGRQANCNGRHPYGGTRTRGPNLERPCVVGMYPPNAWGLHDMHGNVWEWCSDWYSDQYYRYGEDQDPQGPRRGETRVLRGGSWFSPAKDCRAAFRSWSPPSEGHFYAGFRVRFRLR